MREAAVPGYRLSKAKGSTKVLITLGMLGLLLGLISASILTLLKTGISPQSVTNYYLGSTGDSASSADDLEQLIASEPRPLVELAEVTHLHLLGGSMMLFLLCHLLSVCDMKDQTRTVLYLTSFISFFLLFSLPWLIIYASSVCSFIYGPSALVFICSLLALCCLPLKEMWL